MCSLCYFSLCSGQITGIALGVPAGLIFCLVLFFLGMLYHRGLAIRRKRAMRRYLESGEVRLYKTLNYLFWTDLIAFVVMRKITLE